MSPHIQRPGSAGRNTPTTHDGRRTSVGIQADRQPLRGSVPPDMTPQVPDRPPTPGMPRVQRFPYDVGVPMRSPVGIPIPGDPGPQGDRPPRLENMPLRDV